MKPALTEYYLARKPEHYNACTNLWEAYTDTIGPVYAIKFPTIMAKRDNELVGFLGTLNTDDALIAGPLLVTVDGHKSIVALRLVENYEALLRTFGISEYIFGVEKSQKGWVRTVENIIRAKPYKSAKGKNWYRRGLNYGRDTGRTTA